jgi:hypothetical protein
MLLDKYKWSHFGGHWFALFGFLNIAAYGAHIYMKDKENYNYHFSYTADARKLFKPIKAMVGSDNFYNIVWTAPALIGLDLYLHRHFGSLFMTKFFALTVFTSFAFYSIFTPQSGLNFRPLKSL